MLAFSDAQWRNLRFELVEMGNAARIPHIRHAWLQPARGGDDNDARLPGRQCLQQGTVGLVHHVGVFAGAGEGDGAGSSPVRREGDGEGCIHLPERRHGIALPVTRVACVIPLAPSPPGRGLG